MHALVLQIVDSNKGFVVCIDDSKRGLGGVLMQDGQVVCYESRKLNENDKNYLKHYLELAAIIHAFNMLGNYFLGRRFFLMSEHIGLRYLFVQPNLNFG